MLRSNACDSYQSGRGALAGRTIRTQFVRHFGSFHCEQVIRPEMQMVDLMVQLRVPQVYTYLRLSCLMRH
jgi:hypothetical protein